MPAGEVLAEFSVFAETRAPVAASWYVMAGDVPRLDDLLREARWVRTLARRLCADGATADDLTQDAWLAAVEHPPRDAGRAWFARVLGNLAARRGSSESSRRARETAAARDESFTEDLVARADSSRRLVDHVMALDEPYRAALLAHFFDGLAPHEIALRTGTNASTVRTRLERGLVKLRERLQRDGGREWLAALALDPRMLLPSANTLTTGIVMTTGTKIGIALAGALAVLWFVQSWEGARTSTTNRATRAADPELVLAPEPVAPLGEPSTAPSERTTSTGSARGVASEDALVPAAPRGHGGIEGLVLRADVPIAGGKVWHWPGAWRSIPPDPAVRRAALESGELMRVPIDPDGRFRIEGLELESQTMAIEIGPGLGAQTHVTLTTAEPVQHVVIRLGTARIVGRVFDENGRPVGGAAVRLSDPMEQYGLTDATGNYAIEDVPAGAPWISLQAGDRIGLYAAMDHMQRVFGLEAGETRTIDFGSASPSIVWRGRFLQRDGALVPHGGTLGTKDLSTNAYTEKLFEAGAFELHVPARSHCRLQVKFSTTQIGRGTGYLKLGEFAVGDVDREQDIVLAGASVRAHARGTSLPPRTGLSLRLDGGGLTRFAEYGASGSALFVAIPAGRYHVLAGPAFVVDGDVTVDVREDDEVVDVDVPMRRK